MEKLSTGLDWLLVISAAAALLTPVLTAGPEGRPRYAANPKASQFFGLFVVVFALVLLLAYGLQLVAFPAGVIAWGGGALLMFLLGLFKLPLLSRAALLLLISWFMLPADLLEIRPQMQLIGWLGGLVAWKLAASLLEEEQADFLDLLPAALLAIGWYWNHTAPVPATQQAVLPLVLSLSLLLNAVQHLKLPVSNPWALAGMMALIGGMSTWLSIQTFVVALDPAPWVTLFAGAILLGFALQALGAAKHDPVSASQGSLAPNAMISLVLVGIATLVASRLFGTVGWVVLGAAMIAVARPNATVVVAALFWLARVLLQGFIFQYNPNVTGINITHTYASAGLYAGLVLMLLLPVLLLKLRVDNDEAPQKAPLAHLLPLAALVLGGFLFSGLANFFLHAEATGSLLVALVVGGIGVAMLYGHAFRQQVMLTSLWVINGCLLLHDLIPLGNEADKSLKLMVLGAALLVSFGLLWLSLQGLSRKPVEVA